jgi:hypothetical protein
MQIMTPYEAWIGCRPNLSNLHVFGTTAYVHVPKANRQKLNAHIVRAIFLG